ncbi:hypothetical protein [Leptothoe sp. PORK10 BA2]|uniref:hypothetical protein n=1 Tax=Leptothoe sp. PORK10 BA2 TaxID=3110254 RepID=UPI002B21F44F|nr:hypothetical protein [Leptothoe sp. PORK10 BA2]MEA5464473.1 hypothetical protein [Leptothoe sp. PORK10 BA2]
MTIEEILNAVTTPIIELIGAINREYKTKFPELLFPSGSPLANIWNTLVKVRRGNGEDADFSAEGVLDFFPFNFGKNLKNNPLEGSSSTDNPLVIKLKIIIKNLPDSS